MKATTSAQENTKEKTPPLQRESAVSSQAQGQNSPFSYNHDTNGVPKIRGLVSLIVYFLLWSAGILSLLRFRLG